MRVWALLCLATLLGSAGSIAAAKDHGNKYRENREGEDRERHRKYGEACFREDHIRVIHDYYRPRSRPAGLEKKLYRTGHLPPGWERKVQPLPPTVERSLPPLC